MKSALTRKSSPDVTTGWPDVVKAGRIECVRMEKRKTRRGEGRMGARRGGEERKREKKPRLGPTQQQDAGESIILMTGVSRREWQANVTSSM